MSSGTVASTDRRFQPFLVTFDLTAIKQGATLPPTPDPHRLGFEHRDVIAYERRHGVGHYDERAKLLRLTLDHLGRVTRFDADSAEDAIRKARGAAIVYWLGQVNAVTDERTRRDPTRTSAARVLRALEREHARFKGNGAVWAVVHGEVVSYADWLRRRLAEAQSIVRATGVRPLNARGRGQPRPPWLARALADLHAAGIPKRGLPGFGRARAWHEDLPSGAPLSAARMGG